MITGLKMTAAACVAVLVVKAQVYDACQPPMLPSWECRIVATVRHLKTAVPAASPCVSRSVSRGPAAHVEFCLFSKCVLQACEMHVSRGVACIETSACSQPAKRVCIYIYIYTYRIPCPPPFRYMTLAILLAPSTPRYAPTWAGGKKAWPSQFLRLYPGKEKANRAQRESGCWACDGSDSSALGDPPFLGG